MSTATALSRCQSCPMSGKNIVYHKPRQTGKPLCHLPHRRPFLLEQSRKGKPSGISEKRRRGEVYRSEGIDYRPARNLYAIRTAAGAGRFHGGIRRRYDVECVSALHHNKRKTNYHIHLIFSERRLLAEQRLRLQPVEYSLTKRANGYAPKKKSRGRTGRYGRAAPLSRKAVFTNSTFSR